VVVRARGELDVHRAQAQLPHCRRRAQRGRGKGQGRRGRGGRLGSHTAAAAAALTNHCPGARWMDG
jgi:hypothetical protein